MRRSRGHSYVAVAALIKALDHEDRAVRSRAAEALGRIGGDAAVGPLSKALALSDEYSMVIRRAAEALGRIGGDAAVAALIKALDHEDRVVKRWAAAALGRIGSDAAVAALIKALDHEYTYVRWMAAEALGRIRSDAAIDPLSAEALIRIDSDVTIDALIRRALEYISEVEARERILLSRYMLEAQPSRGIRPEIITSESLQEHNLTTHAGDAFLFKLSLLHPRKLSKRLSTEFIVYIYSLEKSQETRVLIEAEKKRQWLGQSRQLQEHTEDAELPTDLAVSIQISCPAIDFFSEATRVKFLRVDRVDALHFVGQPKDTCAPGIHTALLLITNKKTGHEYKSISFPVEVVDFAFDKVSSPSLSKMVTVVLITGSAATFVLTFLG